MLYRLDYLDTDGDITGPVLCWHVGTFPPTSDVLTRHMTTARERAIQAAAKWECDVLVTRIGKSGQLRPSLVLAPDGTARKPGGMTGEDCKAGPGQPPCFCRNCRAGRRAR